MFHLRRCSCKVTENTHIISTSIRRAAHPVILHDHLEVASAILEVVKYLCWLVRCPVRATIYRTAALTGNDSIHVEEGA